MSIKTDILWRVGLVYLAVALFAVAIVVKIVFLQFVDDDQWKEKAKNTRIQNKKIPPHRGDIYAADMRLLASSIPYYEVRMDMKTPALSSRHFHNKVDSLAICLSKLFGNRSKDEYKRNLVQAYKLGKRYHLIKSQVNYIELKKLKEFPILRRGKYKGGLIVNPENIRKKPHRNLAARTIGYTTKSSSGNRVGIEGAYEKYLGGVEGLKRMQKISGNVWMPLDASGEIEPKDGSSIVTTIDIDLQDMAEKALLKQLKRHNARAGTAVLMEVQTGDIKAIVNLTDTFGAYREFYNYAVGYSSEPGSTFKLPVLLSAIEDGIVDMDDSINTGNGLYYYYDLPVRDDNYLKGGHGKLSVKGIFEQSSNVGMVKIVESAYKKDPNRLIDRLYSMNLNDPLGLDIMGEGRPLIRYPGDKFWSGVTIAFMSFGYEVKLTPLQMLTFYNAVANNGRMVKPRFATEIRSHGKLHTTLNTEVINPSICSKSTLKKVREMLEGVAVKGTARDLNVPGMSFAGKTGTTLMHRIKTGYKLKDYQASFVGYFPSHKPKYSCIVVIYSPTSGIFHGAQVAGPVFEEIATKVYSGSLNIEKPLNAEKIKVPEIPWSKNGSRNEIANVLDNLDIKFNCKNPASEWVETRKTETRVELNEKRINVNQIPDVKLMGLKDALFILENLGLKVEVDGRGSVRNQSIPPGTRVVKGEKIKLEMSFTEG